MSHTADVIVLGMGGMGSSALYHLALRGVKAAGFDLASPPHELGSTHGETRIIRKAYFEHPDYVPLLQRSYELWVRLESEVQQKLYHPTGILYSCKPDGALLAGLMRSASLHQLPLDRCDARQTAQWADRFNHNPDQAWVFERDAGYLEVENCVQAHLTRAKALGAELFPYTEVQSWESSKNGVKICTDKASWSAKSLVICAGPWAAQVCQDLNLPLRLLRKVLFWFPASENYLEANGTPCFLFETPEGTFYGFPSLEGSGTLKLAEHTGGLPIAKPDERNLPIRQSETSPVENFVAENLPGLGAGPVRHQSCIYTMTPDENFIIDLHPDYSNVAFAAGFSGHGFKFASVVGEILAELALERETRHPIDLLRRGTREERNSSTVFTLSTQSAAQPMDTGKK